MTNTDAILAAVARVETVSGSIITLVQQLAADAGVPQAQIDAMTARLTGVADAVDTAVLANTPQAPPQ